MSSEIDKIIDFWFGDKTDDPEVLKHRYKLWFSSDPVFDAVIKKQFAADHALAARHALDQWTITPRGSLALIIILDQFSRNIYRGQDKAFACDDTALQFALNGIERKQDRDLDPIERSFFYMPMQHAEDLDMQRLGETQYRMLLHEGSAGFKRQMKNNLDWMIEHRRIIEQFGRFPHRNAILGRESSPQETQYLSRGGKRFGQA